MPINPCNIALRDTRSKAPNPSRTILSFWIEICDCLKDVRNTFTNPRFLNAHWKGCPFLRTMCTVSPLIEEPVIANHNPSDPSVGLLQRCGAIQTKHLHRCGWDVDNPESLSDAQNCCKCSHVMPDGPSAAPRLVRLRQKASS